MFQVKKEIPHHSMDLQAGIFLYQFLGNPADNALIHIERNIMPQLVGIRHGG